MSIDNFSPLDGHDENSEPSHPIIIPPELLELVPEEERDEFNRRLVRLGIRISREEHYSGPLQPALEAARWDELVAGTAERSFNLFEDNERMRMNANDRFLTITEEMA